MSELSFDLVVIGAGPGGYVCAIRAAQLGLSTALVEESATLGGTCLNVGCIPSKALLHSTELLQELRVHGKSNGLLIDGLKVDLTQMLARKDQVVARLTKGVNQLCTARKIQIIQGKGRLIPDGKIGVTASDGSESVLTAKNTVIATGSSTAFLPGMEPDGVQIITSTEALSLEIIPATMVVIGAGAIGLELGSVWARLGTKVTVVEFLPQICPSFDKDIATFAQRLLSRQGMSFETDTRITSIEKSPAGCVLTAQRGDKTWTIEADCVLMAVGRKPNTVGLNAEGVGLKLDNRGRIETNAELQTNLPSVWAIGDVIVGPMLAHKAEEEGVAVAERIATGHGHVNYDVIPGVIYTSPEIASVGITERIAAEKGVAIKIGKFPFQANGRAIATDSTDGIVKTIACAKTDRLLGVQIVSRNASELIASVVAHMEYSGSAEDLARTVHAHPTLAEAIKESALAVDKLAIHSL
jgi:dihydrolipoamide dehydrogenase